MAEPFTPVQQRPDHYGLLTPTHPTSKYVMATPTRSPLGPRDPNLHESPSVREKRNQDVAYTVLSMFSPEVSSQDAERCSHELRDMAARTIQERWRGKAERELLPRTALDQVKHRVKELIQLRNRVGVLSFKRREESRRELVRVLEDSTSSKFLLGTSTRRSE
eukprot:TRINITY_DN63004_c0_g1_i1.p2 TRINITY_DN63004_c0_g1~~TRINITY_DN63004_c0_g1_i1.p2  ORF type:complete len:163 (+),score=24.31 TRINITY_DN63004_c0_g1_i1:167-655(+)